MGSAPLNLVFTGSPATFTGESDSDASSAPRTEDEEKHQEGGAEGEEEEEEVPKKPQRGRKRRTEPVVIEREDGTKEEVSPQDWRRLRRRVTNRLSARRMRQKRAEERDAVAAEVSGAVPVAVYHKLRPWNSQALMIRS